MSDDSNTGSKDIPEKRVDKTEITTKEKLKAMSKEQKREHDDFEEHMAFRNYMRDLILGANDGLVSLFALVLGIAGGGQNPDIILLAGIAGAVAGGISMAIGEYLSTKSQEQVYDTEMKIEREHIQDHPEHEITELYEFYQKKGFEGRLLEEVVTTISSDKEIFLKEMMMAEFGIIEEERRSPIMATIIVGIAFLVGSALPVIPFFFVDNTLDGIIFSGITSSIGLFSVGAMKSWITRTSLFGGGGENFLMGIAGAAITYVIGTWVGAGLA